MKKLTMAACAALIAAGATGAFAQAAPGAGGPGGGPGSGRGPDAPRLTTEDFRALVDARIAAIKAGLKFTPEQERLWQPVEAIIRKGSEERATRMEQRRASLENLTPEQRRERMREARDFGERLDRMSERAERMKSFTDAVKPLYASLDERQKRIFPILMRPAGGPGPMMGGGWRGHGHHHDRIDWRGPGRTERL